MEYSIAIASHNRPVKTLAYLNTQNIPLEKIKVFIYEDELIHYSKHISINNLVICPTKGLNHKHNFISSYYEEGTHIFYMDDDIDDIDFSLTNYSSLNEFILSAFETLVKEKLFLFGMYPVFNDFFRKKQQPITDCLNFIIGQSFGFINRHLEELTITCVNKNDVERSIKYYIKDGGVLRYNQIGIKTKMFCKGGLGVKKDRINIFENETNYLLTKYPDVTTAFIRKNGLHEIKLKKYKRVIPFTPIQTPYDPSLFSKLEEMLNSISIHINKNGVGRSKLFKMSYRSCNFGYIVKRGNKKENKELSLYSKKYPLVYEEILKIGKIICPFEFLTITINHNVVCPPHIDSNNQTKSILISLGNYTKGELVIDGYGEFNTRYNAVEFDGSASIHYNNPIIGNKYSLIYYK